MKTERINVKVNEIFKIELQENPTTGYGWVLSHMPDNVYLLDETYIPDPNPKGLFGQGGTKVYHFKAIEESKACEINLKYMRAWENTAIDNCTYKVTIDNKIKYEQITDYFVNNTYSPGQHYLTIDSKERFDEIFSPAAIMFKDQRWIKESDFVNNIVVAIVMPTQEKFTQFKIEDVVENGKNLEVSYAIHKESITWYARCCMILLVEKANYTNVVFYEANNEEAKVNLTEKYAQV
jgi:predicted secreted protein